MKKNIIDLGDIYNNLLNDINPVSFNYINGDTRHFGFIAQDVEEAFNKYEIENSITKTGKDGMYMMNYTEMIPVMWKIIQDLEKRITELEGE